MQGWVTIVLLPIVGNCDGMVKGRRYFQSPPAHGVFVVPHEVLCVTGRKVRLASLLSTIACVMF